MKCHYWNVKVTAKVYKPCLSFFISFSLTSVTFSSSSKPLFPHFIHLSTLTVHTHDVRNIHKTWIAFQSCFIVLTVCTRNVRKDDRLEWLVNRILSFLQSVHVMYKTISDYHQCGARSGSPQLFKFYKLKGIQGKSKPAYILRSIVNWSSTVSAVMFKRVTQCCC